MDNEDVAALEELEDGHWWGEERIYRLVELVKGTIPKSSKILEIGCGTGKILSLLEKENFDCFGVEPSQTGFDSSSTLLPNKIFHGTLDQFITFDRGKQHFDCVLLFDVLEHLENDVSELSSISSLISPEGVVIFSVPADPKLWSKLDEEVYHFRRYTIDSLRALGSSSKLELKYSIYWCSILKGLIRLYRRVFNPTFDENIKKPPYLINSLLRQIIRIERLPAFGRISGVSIFGVFQKSN